MVHKNDAANNKSNPYLFSYRIIAHDAAFLQKTWKEHHITSEEHGESTKEMKMKRGKWNHNME